MVACLVFSSGQAPHPPPGTNDSPNMDGNYLPSLRHAWVDFEKTKQNKTNHSEAAYDFSEALSKHGMTFLVKAML